MQCVKPSRVSVHALCRQVTDAEEEAVKKADERAKVWKTHNGSNSTSNSPNTSPSTSVETVAKDSQAGCTSQTKQPASSSRAERSHSADGESFISSFTRSIHNLFMHSPSVCPISPPSMRPPTHSPTRSPTHPPALPLTYPFTLARSLTPSLTHSLTHSHLLAPSLTRSRTHSPTHAHSLIDAGGV